MSTSDSRPLSVAPLEEQLFLRFEELVAPFDRPAQGSLVLRHVPCPAGEEWQPVLESGEEFARFEHLDAGGGELDREREPV